MRNGKLQAQELVRWAVVWIEERKAKRRTAEQEYEAGYVEHMQRVKAAKEREQRNSASQRQAREAATGGGENADAPGEEKRQAKLCLTREALSILTQISEPMSEMLPPLNLEDGTVTELTAELMAAAHDTFGEDIAPFEPKLALCALEAGRYLPGQHGWPSVSAAMRCLQRIQRQELWMWECEEVSRLTGVNLVDARSLLRQAQDSQPKAPNLIAVAVQLWGSQQQPAKGATASQEHTDGNNGPSQVGKRRTRGNDEKEDEDERAEQRDLSEGVRKAGGGNAANVGNSNSALKTNSGGAKGAATSEGGGCNDNKPRNRENDDEEDEDERAGQRDLPGGVRRAGGSSTINNGGGDSKPTTDNGGTKEGTAAQQGPDGNKRELGANRQRTSPESTLHKGVNATGGAAQQQRDPSEEGGQQRGSGENPGKDRKARTDAGNRRPQDNMPALDLLGGVTGLQARCDESKRQEAEQTKQQQASNTDTDAGKRMRTTAPLQRGARRALQQASRKAARTSPNKEGEQREDSLADLNRQQRSKVQGRGTTAQDQELARHAARSNLSRQVSVGRHEDMLYALDQHRRMLNGEELTAVDQEWAALGATLSPAKVLAWQGGGAQEDEDAYNANDEFEDFLDAILEQYDCNEEEAAEALEETMDEAGWNLDAAIDMLLARGVQPYKAASGSGKYDDASGDSAHDSSSGTDSNDEGKDGGRKGDRGDVRARTEGGGEDPKADQKKLNASSVFVPPVSKKQGYLGAGTGTVNGPLLRHRSRSAGPEIESRGGNNAESQGESTPPLPRISAAGANFRPSCELLVRQVRRAIDCDDATARLLLMDKRARDVDGTPDAAKAVKLFFAGQGEGSLRKGNQLETDHGLGTKAHVNANSMTLDLSMVSSSMRSKKEDLSKNLSQISNDRGSLTSGTIHESLMRVFSTVAMRHFQKVSDEETAAFEEALSAPACGPESGEVLLA